LIILIILIGDDGDRRGLPVAGTEQEQDQEEEEEDDDAAPKLEPLATKW
jgi:hypothetical protein